MVNMDTYLHHVATATSPATESEEATYRRYARMRAMWHAHNTGVMKNHTWKNIRIMSDTWVKWQRRRVVRAAAALTLTRWAHGLRTPPPPPARKRRDRGKKTKRRKGKGSAKVVTPAVAAGGTVESASGVAAEAVEASRQAGGTVMDGAVAGARAVAELSAATLDTLQRVIGSTVTATMKDQLKGHRTAGYELFANRELPFPYSMPVPWQALMTDFTLNVATWGGRVAMADVTYDMFFVLNSNLGTDLMVATLLTAKVTLDEMQTGRVWVKCIVPRGKMDKMTMAVVRIPGAGMCPRFRIGARGVLRVCVTIGFEDRWATPVWINIGSMPFIELYMDLLNNHIVSPEARRLTAMLSDMWNRPTLPPPPGRNLMVKLASLLAPLAKTNFNRYESSRTQNMRFAAFSDAIFRTHYLWARWWNFWRVSNPHLALTPEIGVLRFVTSTQVGTQLLLAAILRCTSVLEELFRGRRHIYIAPKNDDMRELLFVTVARTTRIGPPTPTTTLGGVGPCCIPVIIAADTYVWINVTSLRYAVENDVWTKGIYLYVFKNAVRVLRAVTRWVMRHRKVVQ